MPCAEPQDAPRLGLAQPDGHPAVVAGETVEEAAVRVELAEEQVERVVVPIADLNGQRIDDVGIEAADQLARRMRLSRRCARRQRPMTAALTH